MKKNYIHPTSKCVYLGLENMIAESGIQVGEGEGSHDAASKTRHWYDDTSVEGESINW